MPENKINIGVVVNGKQIIVHVNAHQPLFTLIPQALEQSGNVGQPPENWELRDAAGNLLDTSKDIASFDFPEGVQLYLSLKAGIGGNS